MSAERSLVSPSLPFPGTAHLIDHHCHGVLRTGGDLESLLTEGDGGTTAGGTAFDSLAGLSFRRWCPPALGLEPHASLTEYQERRSSLGPAEVSRRFLSAAGLAALCVDTGYTPADLLSPAETAAFAGAAACEIVRLEQVAESLAREGVTPSAFPDAYRAALAARVRTGSGVPVVGFKSIAAYRVGLDLRPERPADADVVSAATRWLAGPQDAARTDTGGQPRLADETLHRFFIWCGADLGLPVQFHVGYGDRDVDLHQCNPLLLTGLLRALEPSGVPVMLLHNYPYHREAGYLAQVFPSVYADLGLATHNLGSRAPAVLAEALEMVPLRKFLYSSDAFGLPELYYLGALLFRQGLSRFLSARLDDGDIAYDDAERIARLIASGNASRVYGIPAPLQIRFNSLVAALAASPRPGRSTAWPTACGKDAKRLTNNPNGLFTRSHSA
ncbi:MAG: amidohydrolase family protein [Trebonia sp.]